MEGNRVPDNLVVGSLPTLIYIPDFVTENEETQLLDNIYGAPISKWKSLKNRRLQNWGGIVHEKGLLPQSLPPWLTNITQRIFDRSGLFPSAINHVLINEYLPNQGILPHQDGAAYFPVVAIVSLGSPVVMDFTPHSRLKAGTETQWGSVENEHLEGRGLVIEADKWSDNHHPFSVLLMPRSLVIFKDEAYTDYLHAIRDSEVQQYDGVRLLYWMSYFGQCANTICLMHELELGTSDKNVKQTSHIFSQNKFSSPMLNYFIPLFQVVNELEALKDYRPDEPPVCGSGKYVEVVKTGDLKIIHRTKTRISLTCRLVLKVHKKLFKF